MDSEEKIKERKEWNKPFLRAFNTLLYEEGIDGSKGKLCSLIGIQPGLISNYSKGLKKVSLDTMNKIVRVSRGRLNIDFLIGKSEHMMIADIPHVQSCNDVEEEVNRTNNINQQPDASSYLNALLARDDETIASLKRELIAKDDIIQEKEEHIATITKLAEERLHRINELRRIIDANNIDITKYPFTVGVSEKEINRNKTI